LTAQHLSVRDQGVADRKAALNHLGFGSPVTRNDQQARRTVHQQKERVITQSIIFWFAAETGSEFFQQPFLDGPRAARPQQL